MVDILTGTAFDEPKRLNRREDEVALEFPSSVSSRARGLLALKAQNWRASGGGGWKNPYVTNGLVAMWDGEWNAGPGIHDESSPIWKDLVGANDWRIVNGSWEAKALHNGTSAVCAATNVGFVGISKPVTVEYVVWVSSSQDSANAIVIHVMDWYVGYSMERCLIKYRNSDLSIESDSVRKIPVDSLGPVLTMPMATISARYSESVSVRINGTSVTTTSNHAENWYWNDSTVSCIGNRPAGGRGVECRIGCIRYYSRALTDDEIARNLAVDNERFRT